MANAGTVVIIKRAKKGGHAAHHGGAWKVAYADFVTAMMAFFLLLWLLNATTEVQKQGISDYFSPATVSQSSGGAGGLLGGRAISSPGAMITRVAIPAQSLILEPTTGTTEGSAEEEGGVSDGAETSEEAENKARKPKKKEEELRLKKMGKELLKSIKDDPELMGMEEQVMIDLTRDGLRIQIVDKAGRAMFPSASARMHDRTRRLMAQVAKSLRSQPNKVVIAGHTDSKPFRGGNRRYGNWELSADRANAARRALVGDGVANDRIARVTGRADNDPLVPEDPESARNRRISIMLLFDESRPVIRFEPEPVTLEPKEDAKAKGKGKGKGGGATSGDGKDGFSKNWSGPRLR
jgi:chemotaxis protein MotB